MSSEYVVCCINAIRSSVVINTTLNVLGEQLGVSARFVEVDVFIDLPFQDNWSLATPVDLD